MLPPCLHMSLLCKSLDGVFIMIQFRNKTQRSLIFEHPCAKNKKSLWSGFSVSGQRFRCSFVWFKYREIKIKDKYAPFCFVLN